jgi:anti-sigma regulatory factor (Ser/Thr protein kinase)
MTASARNLRAVRKLTAETLNGRGIATDTVDAAQLIVSELVGNCVRADGEHVPVVVEVCVPPFGVAVNVHDPDSRHLPRRSSVALDDPEAESGRGLALLDLLAPAWHIQRSPIGKQIRCRLAWAVTG